VGAVIDVWWPLDQAWYKGLVSGSSNLMCDDDEQ
jgi:hypothetical protein